MRKPTVTKFDVRMLTRPLYPYVRQVLANGVTVIATPFGERNVVGDDAVQRVLNDVDDEYVSRVLAARSAQTQRTEDAEHAHRCKAVAAMKGTV